MDSKQIINKIEKGLSESKNKFIYEATISPHLNDLVLISWYYGAEKTTGLGYKHSLRTSIYLDNTAKGYWVMDITEHPTTSNYMLKHQKGILGHFKEWFKDGKKYYSLVNRFLNKGSKNWIEDYLDLKNAFIPYFGRAAIVENISFGSGRLIDEIKKSYKLSDRLMFDLLKESKKNFITENKESLTNIALKAYDLADYSYQNLQKKHLNIVRLLNKHQQKFFWLENNYHDTKIISSKEFWKRTKTIIKFNNKKELVAQRRYFENYGKVVKKKKNKIKNKHKISKKDFKLLQFLSTMAYWQDARKKAGLIMSYWVTEFMKLASKKYRVPFNDLRYLISDEFIKFLKYNGEYNKIEVKKRQEQAIHLHTKTEKSYIVSGNGNLKKLIQQLLFIKDERIKKDEIKGTTASIGKFPKTEGKVRVVLNPRGVVFNKGDILVTSMTRPEYVPLARRARAIITNEGGITCHAAIISRELNIPCIIGTKIATKVLHDGDIVEVDANKGIVKIIK